MLNACYVLAWLTGQQADMLPMRCVGGHGLSGKAEMACRCMNVNTVAYALCR